MPGDRAAPPLGREVKRDKIMTTTADKALVRAFFEDVLRERKLERLDEMVTADYVLHRSGDPRPMTIDGHRALIGAIRAAFPDWREEILQQIAGEGHIVTIVRGTGTHRGDFMGIPPTGKVVSFESVNIDRFEDGRIAERRVHADLLSALVQLGMVPPPG